MNHLTLSTVLLAALASPLAARQETPGNAADHWGADYFPNIELTTHEGKHVRFFDDLVKGKVVMINFIYTSCPDSCPLETARLAEVQDILGERVGRDVFMYSISIDPARDTPEKLAQYAERFQTKPGWLFLTGKESDVALLREKLGLLGADDKELKSHNLSLIIGNQASGRWMRRSPFENAYVLANQLGDWLHDWKDPRPAGQSYANAPELRTISRGESLFRTRCSACHTVGGGDGLAHVGPSLWGVSQRRERAWLEHWIAAPDEMLEQQDSIATGLFAAYNRVPMPNMRLNELEITALIEFIDEETQRVADEQAHAGHEPAGCCAKRDTLVLGADADAKSAEDATALVESTATPEAKALVTADGPSDEHSKPSSRNLVSIGAGFALGLVASLLGRRKFG